jgi:hypothetical protein
LPVSTVVCFSALRFAAAGCELFCSTLSDCLHPIKHARQYVRFDLTYIYTESHCHGTTSSTTRSRHPNKSPPRSSTVGNRKIKCYPFRLNWATAPFHQCRTHV